MSGHVIILQILIETTADREKYCDEKGINEKLKEEWARLRCGNIAKWGRRGMNIGAVGYVERNMNCERTDKG